MDLATLTRPQMGSIFTLYAFHSTKAIVTKANIINQINEHSQFTLEQHDASKVTKTGLKNQGQYLDVYDVGESRLEHKQRATAVPNGE